MMEIKTFEEGFKLAIDGYILMHHTYKTPFLKIGKAEGKFQLNHGIYKIKEKIEEEIPLINYKIKNQSENNLIIDFSSNDEKINLTIVFTENEGQIRIKPQTDLSFNRSWFRFVSNEHEAFYGCGEQFSEVNLQGKKVPLWCQEQGVGRGDPLWFTFLANLLYDGVGGDHYTTYYPQPTLVSSKNYFCHVETTAYSIFNFRQKEVTELYFWDIPEIIIGKYETASKTIGALATLLGKQSPLPDWMYDGIILGLQGGKEVVNKKLQTAKEHGLPVSAVWCQDWEGKRETAFGRQLFWDWIYAPKLYPDLPGYIAELHEKGIKFLGYINCFLAIEGELYKEASKKELLVKNCNGEDYPVVTTTFPAVILDITNPETENWIKQVIKENLIKVGLDGWMADYGEYLPTDAVLYSGESAETFHNRYPVEWARINKEALKEAEKLNDVVFFSRAGYSSTSQHSQLIWAGDQLVTFSKHDGLASCIPAGISLGICGIGNYHFDIGGYTTVGPFKRSKEVFMRWVEFAAFTMVMRTHEGNRPDDNWQFDSDEETLNHLAKMTRVHVKLKTYLKSLVTEYSETGIPPFRACYIHYENDKNLHSMKYQYMLGRELLVAPIINKKRNKRKIYLPEDQWIHLWTSKEYEQGWVEVKAPIGQPPVFYRKNASKKWLELFESIKETKI